MWGSPEKTSDGVEKKGNNSRYLYRQLRHVEKELGFLGPSRFPNPDSFKRAMQQVQGMKSLLEYHLPSSSLEGDQLGRSPSPEESVDGAPAKKCCQGGLPWWFVFVGWILVIATSGVSGYFTMMYGLTYGKDRSISWLISMVVSFFESLFVTQPLKVKSSIIITVSYQLLSYNKNKLLKTKYNIKDFGVHVYNTWDLLVLESENLLSQVLGFAAFFALVLKKVDTEEYGEPQIDESLKNPGILYTVFFACEFYCLTNTKRISGNSLVRRPECSAGSKKRQHMQFLSATTPNGHREDEEQHD